MKFKMPSLYREDLKKIEEIFFEIPDRRNYKLEVNGFEYVSVDEIPVDSTTTNKINISTYNPYIHISLKQFEAEVYGSGDNATQLVGMITRIATILRKRERKFHWFNARILIMIFPGIFLNLLVSSIDSIKTNIHSTETIITIFILVILLIFIMIGVRDSMFKFSKIHFSTKSSTVNWFTKNRDQIIFQIIGAVFAGFVGYMLGQLN